MKRITTKIITLTIVAALMTGSITACAGGTKKEDEAEPSEIEKVEPSAEPSEEEPTTTTSEESTTEEPTTTTTQAATDPAIAPVVGGWEISRETIVTGELSDIFKSAVESSNDYCIFEPRLYLASQVVAGTNHCFLATAGLTQDDGTRDYYWVLVYIYEDLNGDCTLLDIKLLEWNLEPMSNGFAGLSEFPNYDMPKGYIYDSLSINSYYESMIADALAESGLDTDLDAEAFLGTGVWGANFTFLAKQVDANGNACWGLLVCNSTDGSTKFIGYYPIEIGI